MIKMIMVVGEVMIAMIIVEEMVIIVGVVMMVRRWRW